MIWKITFKNSHTFELLCDFDWSYILGIDLCIHLISIIQNSINIWKSIRCHLRQNSHIFDNDFENFITFWCSDFKQNRSSGNTRTYIEIILFLTISYTCFYIRCNTENEFCLKLEWSWLYIPFEVIFQWYE